MQRYFIVNKEIFYFIYSEDKMTKFVIGTLLLKLHHHIIQSNLFDKQNYMQRHFITGKKTNLISSALKVR